MADRRAVRPARAMLLVVVAMVTTLTAVPGSATTAFIGVETPALDGSSLHFVGGQAINVPARIASSDPVAAAIEISRIRWADDQAEWAVLSRDDTFPDSLAGAPLIRNGPMLFTPTASYHRATRTELNRVLKPGSTVYLLGGQAALSPAVAAAVAADGYDVVRLAGETRVQTALAVASEVLEQFGGKRVLVARAFGDGTAAWADSVSGGAGAVSAGLPIVITPTASLDPSVAAWLRDLAPVKTYVLGGPAALSDQVLRSVPNGVRVAGETRADTASQVAKAFFGVTTTTPTEQRTFLIINGWHQTGWALGMASAAVAGTVGAPLLMTHHDEIPTATRELVGACEDQVRPSITVVGAADAISSARESELRSALHSGCEPAQLQGSYTFMITNGDGSPVRYGPCTDIGIVANFTGAQAGSREAFARTLDALRSSTGLNLVYEGETSERLSSQNDNGSRPLEQSRYGDGYAPILLNWPSNYDGGSWGFAGSFAVSKGGSPMQYVTGVASLNSRAPASGDTLEQLILHELGHVFGLNHVDDDAEVMFPTVNAGLRAYGAGDRSGLRLLGRQPGEC